MLKDLPKQFRKQNDIAVLIKQTEFDEKLNDLNKNATSNKTKHVLVENGWNELSKKVEDISTKQLTKDW